VAATSSIIPSTDGDMKSLWAWSPKDYFFCKCINDDNASNAQTPFSVLDPS